jgi:arylsulfatase
MQQQVEGRSLLRFLENPKAPWPDRILVTHLGRWPRGKASDSKYAGCSIRDRQFTLVNNGELYDLRRDRGERTNVAAEHPDVVRRLRAEYDKWWDGVLPCLENENVIGPKANPFHELYYQQFGAADNTGNGSVKKSNRSSN